MVPMGEARPGGDSGLTASADHFSRLWGVGLSLVVAYLA